MGTPLLRQIALMDNGVLQKLRKLRKKMCTLLSQMHSYGRPGRRSASGFMTPRQVKDERLEAEIKVKAEVEAKAKAKAKGRW